MTTRTMGELIPAVRSLIDSFVRAFDVERRDGYGIDSELESFARLASESVHISPGNADAAPAVFVFTDFPGVFARFGRWHTDAFPACGCGACQETPEGEFDHLRSTMEALAAGRFREAVHVGEGKSGSWREWEIASQEERRSARTVIDHAIALALTGGAAHLRHHWKAWARRLP